LSLEPAKLDFHLDQGTVTLKFFSKTASCFLKNRLIFNLGSKKNINNDFEKTASKMPQIGTKKQEKAYYL
jgi:hypothetical protein